MWFFQDMSLTLMYNIPGFCPRATFFISKVLNFAKIHFFTLQDYILLRSHLLGILEALLQFLFSISIIITLIPFNFRIQICMYFFQLFLRKNWLQFFYLSLKLNFTFWFFWFNGMSLLKDRRVHHPHPDTQYRVLAQHS